jgi:hypothetical protein
VALERESDTVRKAPTSEPLVASARPDKSRRVAVGAEGLEPPATCL